MAAERAAPEKPTFRPAGCSRSCRVLFSHSKKCLRIVLTRCNKTSRWRPAPKGRKQLAFAKANLQRLLRRSVTRLGARFADYAVVVARPTLPMATVFRKRLRSNSSQSGHRMAFTFLLGCAG